MGALTKVQLRRRLLQERAALLDNVGCRPQDPDERRTVCDFIRAVYPA